MKAILLNSGMGTRIAHITKDKPKCLIDLDESTTILSQQIRHFLDGGISEFLITTGHCAEILKEYFQKHFPQIKVNYVHNSLYTTTNYIYSLHLSRDFIDDDVILAHGDLVFEKEVLRRLLDCPDENCIPMNTTLPLPPSDFKGRIREGRVVEIGIDTFGPDCYFVPPLYKLSLPAFRLWLKGIESLILHKQYIVHAENALNRITGEVPLAPVRIDGLFCAEVDNQTDLDAVREYRAKNKEKFV